MKLSINYCMNVIGNKYYLFVTKKKIKTKIKHLNILPHVCSCKLLSFQRPINYKGCEWFYNFVTWPRGIQGLWAHLTVAQSRQGLMTHFFKPIFRFIKETVSFHGPHLTFKSVPLQVPCPLKKQSCISIIHYCSNRNLSKPTNYGPGRHQAQNWQGIMSKVKPMCPSNKRCRFITPDPSSFQLQVSTSKKNSRAKNPNKNPTPAWNSTTCRPP